MRKPLNLVAGLRKYAQHRSDSFSRMFLAILVAVGLIVLLTACSSPNSTKTYAVTPASTPPVVTSQPATALSTPLSATSQTPVVTSQPPPASGSPPSVPGGTSAIVPSLPAMSGKLVVSSSVVKEGGDLGDKYTGNGVVSGIVPEALSLPLSWTGAPAGTKSFAVIISHMRGGNDEGIFFVVYNIPGTATGIPEGMKPGTNDPAIGTIGRNDQVDRYRPPGATGATYYESPGGGTAGTYKYTVFVYALSDMPKVQNDPNSVDAAILRKAMDGITLDAASLNFNVVFRGLPK